MLKTLAARFQQGHRTIRYPDAPPAIPDRFRGRPEFDPVKCASDCGACVQSCPVGALSKGADGLRMDLGRCLFCTDCTVACSSGGLRFTQDYRLAARKREDLLSDGRTTRLTEAAGKEIRGLFGRSLKLRQISAGGCNACEADVNVLGTVVFDLGRFGIQMVASPRHADGILVTGPVTENMRVALLKTYEAVPAPKIVIASGACAISGGPYSGHPEAHNGVDKFLPVDLYIPGCPPHPMTILDGLLRFLGQVRE